MDSNNNNNVKPEGKQDNAGSGGDVKHVNVKVKNQNGNEVHFKIKRTTPLRRLMDAYCQRQSVDPNSVSFMFDGMRVDGDQTPESLEMENEDSLDVFLNAVGGQ